MSFVKAMTESDLQPGNAVRVDLDGRAVALVKTSDGKIFAVADICSHEDASLSEGYVEDGRIECPRHGAQFDLASGQALTLPAVESIATYEVKVENGEILVNIT